MRGNRHPADDTIVQESEPPPQVALGPTLARNTAALYQVPLIPLNGSAALDATHESQFPLQVVAKRQLRHQSHYSRSSLPGMMSSGRADVSIVFVVRHPGCSQCREHAVQLTNYVEQLQQQQYQQQQQQSRGGGGRGRHQQLHRRNSRLSTSTNVALLGIVKGVEGMLNFYNTSFRFPLYLDRDQQTFQLMVGDNHRPLNLRQIYWGNVINKRRFKKKSVPYKPRVVAGDLDGGLLFFDARGELKFCYQTEFGKELDMAIIKQTIDAIRAENERAEDMSWTESSHSLWLSRKLRTEALNLVNLDESEE